MSGWENQGWSSEGYTRTTTYGCLLALVGVVVLIVAWAAGL